jgi:hypothetical protein
VLYDAIREQIEESRRLAKQSRTLLHIGQAQVARSLANLAEARRMADLEQPRSEDPQRT